jgi:hypothetical protein
VINFMDPTSHNDIDMPSLLAGNYDKFYGSHLPRQCRYAKFVDGKM